MPLCMLRPLAQSVMPRELPLWPPRMLAAPSVTREHTWIRVAGKHGRGGIATDREDGEDGAMVCEDVMPLADSVTTLRDQALQDEGVGRRLPHVAEQPGDGDDSVEGRGIGGEARSSGTSVSPGMRSRGRLRAQLQCGAQMPMIFAATCVVAHAHVGPISKTSSLQRMR